MEIKAYTLVFKKEKKILHRYFLKMIREKTSYKGDLRPLVRDLIDQTHAEAYKKILQGGLSKLPESHIIRIKARDVFYDSIKCPKKKPKLVDMPPDMYENASSDPDPFQQMVLKEEMENLKLLLGEAGKELFEQIADDVPSRVITANLDITLTALTTRIYRLRKQIKEHFTKGF
jgi:DNA-directed RNA polymerase specialized sigma24 family protein